jgi:hypothetical protein
MLLFAISLLAIRYKNTQHMLLLLTLGEISSSGATYLDGTSPTSMITVIYSGKERKIIRVI